MQQQINSTDGNKTPLIFSIQKGWSHKPVGERDTWFHRSLPQEEIAKRLLQLGADVHAKDYFGRTALHYAYLHRDIEAIQALLHYSADQTIEDMHGNTPSYMSHYFLSEAEHILENAVGVFTLDPTQWSFENENKFRDELQSILVTGSIIRNDA